MYSVPGRSVHRFLHAKLQVWQPMHLSRWKTIETWERTFIHSPFRPLIPLGAAFELVNDHIGVPVRRCRSVIVESIRMLSITADHQHRLEPHPRNAVRSSAAPVVACRGFGERDGTFRCVIENADSPWDARAHDSPRDDNSVVVVSLNPFVVLDPASCASLSFSQKGSTPLESVSIRRSSA